MKTVVQPYDEEVDVTVLEVDMPEPELLEQKTGSPEVTPEDWEKVKPIYTDFMQSYTSHPEQPVEQWLGGKLQEYLPEEPSEEIHKMTDEIVTTLHRNEAMHQSLQEAVANGRSKESWFAAQTQKSVSAMSTQEASVYLAELDKALDTANEQLYHTIITKAGVPSQNPNLDGYIAEQYHAQTFNLNAEAAGSEYRAKVLEPDGAYGKNSVDVVIVSSTSHILCGPPVQFLFFAYHAALLEERDAITEDVIIVIPEVRCIHPVIDLLNGSITGIRQSIQSFGILGFKNRHTAIADILYNDIAATFTMLFIGFHYIASTSKNACKESVVEILPVVVVADGHA